MLHCDLRVRWSDLRFRVAMSEPKPFLSAGFLSISLRQPRKSLAIAIVQFGALPKGPFRTVFSGGILGSGRLLAAPPGNRSCAFRCSVSCLRSMCALCAEI